MRTQDGRNERTYIGGVGLDQVSMQSAEARIIDLARDHGKSTAVVVTPNIQHVALWRTDVEFRQSCIASELVLPDGWPVVTAMRLLDGYHGKRVTGSDLAPRVCQAAAREGLSIGLIGGQSDCAAIAAQRLRQQVPGLQIPLAASPQFCDRPTEIDVRTLVGLVNPAKIDILLLCIGTPKSELLAAAAASELEAGVVLCFGAAIDFIAGSQTRAPSWLQGVGMEWAYRVAKEPKRLASRYAVAAPKFIQAIAQEKRTRRRQGRDKSQ